MDGTTRSQSVLLVASDPEAVESLSFWFEREGFEVLACPGPADAHAACLQPAAAPCPLAVAADLVVLDLSPGRVEPVRRRVRRALIERYAGWGRPLLVLDGPDESGAIPEEAGTGTGSVVVLSSSDRAGVVWAARLLVASS